MANLQVSRSLQDRPIEGSITANPGASIPAKDNTLVSSDALSLEEKNEKDTVEHPDEITKDAQIGVQKAEAAAMVWSRKAVYATYAWIWVCWFVLALQSSISSNMIYYAYADFASAPQITQAFVVSIIVGGVLQLPIAKTLNLWGRAEGYVVFLAIMVIGLIVIASCSGPSSFAAGYTLYQVGYSSTGFILNIFVADTSGLRNRAFAYSFAATPFICTAYVGSLAAESFLKTATWRWSYGAFAIIIFVTLAPVAVIFKYYQRKAEKMGLFVRIKSGRTVTQSIIHYFHEFDIVGGLLLMAAFTLFLLSFTLQQYGYNGYKSATFICMLVIGILLLPIFAIWEKYFAKRHFIKYELFKNQTVLGASLLAAVVFFNFYTWDSYFYYYIQVVFNLSTSKTGYVTQVYNVIQPFWAVVFGIWIRQTRYFKNVTLYFGAPLIMLGAGLMIYFRGDESKLGFVIMCQVFIAVGGATLIIGDEMAVMAAADRDGVPMMLAILGIWSSLGGAIGYSVASAIYTNTFPQALLSRLPIDAQAEFSNIYLGGSATQLLYPPGTATRDAIDYAWAHSQKYLCIAAAVVIVLAFPSIAVWKNYNVDKKQVKGTVI